MTWKIPTEFPDLSNAPLIAIDVETCDPKLLTLGPGGARGDGYLLGVSVATENFNCYYPLRHPQDNCDLWQVKTWLIQQLSGKQPKIGANILYDLEWLQVDEIKVNGPKYDIQIAEWLLDEDKKTYTLNSLCLQYLKKTKSEQKLKIAAERLGIKESEIKSNLWRMHPSDVAEYGAADAKDALDIWNLQKPKLTEENLDNVFYDVEMPLIDVLLAMRFRGVLIDVDKAEQVRQMLLKKQAQDMVKMIKLVGNEVDVWSGQDIEKGAIKLGLPYVKTEKDNPSFTSDWLETRQEEYYKLALSLRQLDRAGNIFIEKNILELQKNGRIFPTFRQARNDDGGTRSGRFAAAHPSMHNMPSHGEIADLIRSIFIAEQKKRFGVFDYSQQEPRATVHYAHLNSLPGAKEARQRYIDNPETDYHQMVADIAGIDRPTAKTMNLGLAYGMGKPKMAAALGVSIEEATVIYNKYHSNVPFVKALTNLVSNIAETRGYIKTLSGRRRRFNLWGPKKYTKGVVPKLKAEAMIEFDFPIVRYFTYRGANSVIQGSCADMIKIAMAQVYQAGYLPILTRHDELDFNDIESDGDARVIRDIMINCLDNIGKGITVPLTVDIKLGKSWGEAEKVKL